jgi:peptide deformylase
MQVQKSNKIILLGDPRLHQKSEDVKESEVDEMQLVVQDLHDILFEFKERFKHYGAFRGIAAPQIGVMKRLIYLNIDKPIVLFNPILENLSEEMFEVWDDCMCFPNLLVKLKRHQSITVRYRDEYWDEQTMHLEGSLSELLQHEYDHLEGILATEKAIDNQSFRWRR